MARHVQPVRTEGCVQSSFLEPRHPRELINLPAAYETNHGAMYCGDARDLLAALPDGSVNLVITSPPYALHFKKEYGNVDKEEYVEWFRPFGKEIRRVLKQDGSFVLNLGGSYNQGKPTRSLYHLRVLLMLCDDIGFHLAQECFWFNPAKLPSPAEWVNVRRIRLKDSVEYVWWLAPGPMPKANNRRVLVEYSNDMRRLLERGYKAKQRPSGHNITDKFTDRGGSIAANLISEELVEDSPCNLLVRGNNESNSSYLRLSSVHKLSPHPARFPAALPRFFIQFLTDPGDLVVDPFAGSNTTGAVAEELERTWLGFELEPKYVTSSGLRFGIGPITEDSSGG